MIVHIVLNDVLHSTYSQSPPRAAAAFLTTQILCILHTIMSAYTIDYEHDSEEVIALKRHIANQG
jgi:hypothetical protein